jgi:hypothetical protein
LFKSFVTAAAVVLVTTTMGVGTAEAAKQAGPVREQTSGIKWFGHTVKLKKNHPDKAIVTVRYKCQGVGIHLWASVKQGPGVNSYKSSAERPSPPADVARSWYETPEGPVPFCDGKAHTLRYVISRVTEGSETHPQPWGKLKCGRAWAQFVIFSVPEGADPAETEPTREAFAGWVHVRK